MKLCVPDVTFGDGIDGCMPDFKFFRLCSLTTRIPDAGFGKMGFSKFGLPLAVKFLRLIILTIFIRDGFIEDEGFMQLGLPMSTDVNFFTIGIPGVLYVIPGALLVGCWNAACMEFDWPLGVNIFKFVMFDTLFAGISIVCDLMEAQFNAAAANAQRAHYQRNEPTMHVDQKSSRGGRWEVPHW